MTTVDFEPLNVAVPLWDALRAFSASARAGCFWSWCSVHSNGATRRHRPGRMDAAIGRCVRGHQPLPADPAPVDKYLRRCDEEAEAVRDKIEASQRPGPSKEELLSRRGRRD